MNKFQNDCSVDTVLVTAGLKGGIKIGHLLQKSGVIENLKRKGSGLRGKAVV
jgi:hypothetical protein